MLRNRAFANGEDTFLSFLHLWEMGITTLPSEGVPKSCRHSTDFPHTFPRSVPQGPLSISLRTPSTDWRNSASVLIARSTLRIEWITVE